MKVLPLTARKNSHLWLRISLWTFHIRSRYVMTTSEPSPHGGDCALLRRPKADWIFASERERERERDLCIPFERIRAPGGCPWCINKLLESSFSLLSFFRLRGYRLEMWKCKKES
jgi:hypothetical protein